MDLPILAICLIVGVSDGDTITARCGDVGNYEQIKVRLNGIDAPERKQPFGTRSRQAMSDLVFGKYAKLDCPKKDRYGRYICTVWVAKDSRQDVKNIDAGHALITQGLAWHYKRYSKDLTLSQKEQYDFSEKEAKCKYIGLWSNPNPIAPWEWRRSRKRK